MSSYIVDDITINRITTWISRHHQFNRNMYSCMIREVLEKYNLNLETEEDYQRFANSLMKLNRMAVNDRYQENKAITLMQYKDVQVTDIQALKSMQCLSYQCCEGDIPNTALYKCIEELIRTLQKIIIDQLEEYKSAEWG